MKLYFWIAFTIMIIVGFSCSNTKTNKSEKSEQSSKEKADVTEGEKEAYTPLNINYGYPEHIKLNDSIKNELSKRGELLAAKTGHTLMSELYKAIRKGGYENAISFCSKRAMVITDSISKAEMVMIKRIAKKNRNPYNTMSDNESNLYKSYVIQYINGQQMKSTIGWDKKGRPVYYHPIFTQQMCLNCHGKPGTEIKPEVMKKLAQLYPNDKATGFMKGEIRGMWAVTFPEYIVTGVEH